MVNPQWGYWGPQWARVSPAHPVFRFFNEMAWGTEVVAGLLMLLPQTRFLGAALILFSFIFIATQIRLGFLCEMVIVCCLVFFYPGSAGDVVASALLPSSAPPAVSLWNPWIGRAARSAAVGVRRPAAVRAIRAVLQHVREEGAAGRLTGAARLLHQRVRTDSLAGVLGGPHELRDSHLCAGLRPGGDRCCRTGSSTAASSRASTRLAKPSSSRRCSPR